MKVCILGVEYNSENKGCGALGFSFAYIIKQLSDEMKETLEIYSIVYRPEPHAYIPGTQKKIECLKYEPKKINFWLESYKLFKKCDLIIDFTWGDSFSDIYGKARFYKSSMTKELALFSKTPFILGPQTFGPFSNKLPRVWANRIVKKSDICFSRDKMSHDYIRNNIGSEAIQTTDVAFSLPFNKNEKVPMDKKIKIGYNPSGLLWDGQNYIDSNRRIKVDYVEYTKQIISNLISQEIYEIYLIPHVYSEDLNSPENDLRACSEINKFFPQTIVAPAFRDPMEAKSYISNMDIFIGARMHATIAALSSGVFTIPFSYSRKFEGLYGDLNYHFVISATASDTNIAVETTLDWIANYKSNEIYKEKSLELIEEKRKEFYKSIKKVILNTNK